MNRKQKPHKPRGRPAGADRDRAARAPRPRRVPAAGPPIDVVDLTRRVHAIVDALGAEVLTLKVTEQHDVLLTVDQDPGPVESALLVRVVQTLRRSLHDQGYDPGDFRIEVDSPGERRVLRTARHFERFAGADVHLHLHGGARQRVRLLGKDGEQARVRDGDGAERTIDPADYFAIRLAPGAAD